MDEWIDGWMDGLRTALPINGGGSESQAQAT